MPKVFVSLLGKFSLSTETPARVCDLPHLPKLVLVYFLFHRQRWHTREEVVDRFWPEHAPKKAASSLTSTLTRLHQALPPELRPLIRSCGSNALMLSEDVKLWVDTDAFEAEASLDEHALNAKAAERLRAVMRLYHGDLLPGWREDWVLAERERLRHLYFVSLRRLMSFYEGSGALERALACGQRLLRYEPLHEGTHEALMRIYLRTGFRAAALKQYEVCRNALEAEFGVEPNHRLRELYRKALNPAPKPRSQPARSSTPKVTERAEPAK